MVSLQHIVNGDFSITQIADLPLGWIAVRSQVGEIWHRRKKIAELN